MECQSGGTLVGRAGQKEGARGPTEQVAKLASGPEGMLTSQDTQIWARRKSNACEEDLGTKRRARGEKQACPGMAVGRGGGPDGCWAGCTCTLPAHQSPALPAGRT